MSNPNQQHPAPRESRAKALLSDCTFDFKDVPISKYAETLSVLFANPDYAEAVKKRNRLVQSSSRLRPNTNEKANIVRAIQQHDRKLADLMYLSVVQMNLSSDTMEVYYSFGELLAFFVDYHREGIRDRVDDLARHLDSFTFLSDMLESILVDIHADMRSIFGDEVEFRQFDAVQHVLKQLRGFFNNSRPLDGESPEAQLYFEYSDSINEFIAKRLKTYTTRYRKLHPASPAYGENDYLKALKDLLGDDFGPEYISHTNTGGAYINGLKLLADSSASQIKKLEKIMPKEMMFQHVESPIKYNFAITEVIMLSYKKKKKG